MFLNKANFYLINTSTRNSGQFSTRIVKPPNYLHSSNLNNATRLNFTTKQPPSLHQPILPAPPHFGRPRIPSAPTRFRKMHSRAYVESPPTGAREILIGPIVGFSDPGAAWARFNRRLLIPDDGPGRRVWKRLKGGADRALAASGSRRSYRRAQFRDD